MEWTKLMNPDILEDLPPLHSQENVADPHATIKYYLPGKNKTWYAIEYGARERLFFGLVVGLDIELTYFHLDDLYSLATPLDAGVERDMWFPPTSVSKLRKFHEKATQSSNMPECKLVENTDKAK